MWAVHDVDKILHCNYTGAYFRYGVPRNSSKAWLLYRFICAHLTKIISVEADYLLYLEHLKLVRMVAASRMLIRGLVICILLWRINITETSIRVPTNKIYHAALIETGEYYRIVCCAVNLPPNIYKQGQNPVKLILLQISKYRPCFKNLWQRDMGVLCVITTESRVYFDREGWTVKLFCLVLESIREQLPVTLTDSSVM